jgi:hypothetical protein
MHIPTHPRGGDTARRSHPAHSTTGSRGYFGYRSSVFERSHIENVLPRVLWISFWWRQESHSPALMG